jgi:hypothetical protein
MYNQHMKIVTAIILIFSVISNSVSADVTEYDFEIIIFEDTSGRYANKEQWQYELPEQEGNLTEAKRNSGEDIDITPIKGIGLNRYARKLKSSKRYNVLVHKAWRQTGLAEDAAIDIPVDSRKVSPGTTATASDNNHINGSIKIVLGRYLHIYTDMTYQQPDKDLNTYLPGEDAQQYRQYPIRFHRRMRSKELHYLDHPLVGILVMAMPVEQQKENT